MSESLKLGLMIAATTILIIAIMCGTVLAYSYINSINPQPIEDFSIVISIPRGFNCWLDSSDEATQVLICDK